MSQVRLILGDFHTKIGKEQCYRNTVGIHSLYATSNENGSKLIDFAVVKELVIKSTMFPRKDIHKYTWISLDGKYKNQIDHVLINRFKNGIRNIKTLRWSDLDLDHLLVGIRVRVKFKILNKQRVVNTGRFDINKLEDQSTNGEFSHKIKDILQGEEVVADADVDRNWRQIRKDINSVATTILRKKISKTKPWFNRICEETLKN